MPWTFAHPAAVLPLRRLCPAYLSFAALVVGSLTPDMGYYVGHIDLRAATHTLAGAVTICVPLGLALLLIVRLLHRPVAHLLPQPHRAALLSLPAPQPFFAARTLLVAIVSLLLGALTHIAWDAFTHRTGYFVLHLDALQAPLFRIWNREIRVYSLLQYVSTAAGIAILVAAYSRFLRDTPSRAERTGADNARYLLFAVFALGALGAAIPMAYADATSVPGYGLLNVFVLVVRTVIYSTTVFATLVAAAALLAGFRRHVRRTER